MRIPRTASWVMLLLAVVLLLLPLAAVFAADVPREAMRYQRDLTRNARLAWGLDAPVATFAAQIHQESLWDANAVSHVGAQGMAQFMPATARWWCEINKLSSAECQPRNPAWAMRALVGYDKWLWDRIPGESGRCERMALTLRAYNGGLGYVQKELRTGKPCLAFRAGWACRENLGYPRRILVKLEPVYAQWGGAVCING